ncbi:MAG: hypothetical protein IPI23_07800 [Bacteroidetes bacterium]|nr:hypothetical protein [Bacteroidota bacterium]
MKTKKEVEDEIWNIKIEFENSNELGRIMIEFGFTHEDDNSDYDVYSIVCADGILYVVYHWETHHLDFANSLADAKK